MAVGTLYTAKNQSQTYQPLLLAVITFKDSAASPTILRLSTHGLNAPDNGFVPSGITSFPHNGQAFEARINNKEIAATQALSENGIDITPTVALELADADKVMWAKERTLGFKGAKLELFFIFWNAGLNDFSSDFRTIFVGTCGPAKVSEKLLTIQAVSRMNMNQTMFPNVRIQKRCPWTFPDTTGLVTIEATARHQEAADDPSSDFWLCGYSPLATGSNARGNLDGSGNHYPTCSCTFDACIERLGDSAAVWNRGTAHSAPIEKDQSGRVTGHFGGVRWDQPTKFKSRGYLDAGKTTEGFNATNEAKYNDYIPMGWGTFWVDPIVLNVVGDANLTKMEVLLMLGESQGIHKVICNDVEVDQINESNPNPQLAVALWWNWVSRGTREGAVNYDTIYDGTGDCYGNTSVININIPRTLSPSSSIPRVRVLMDGPKIRIYSDTTTFTVAFSRNPAWILMDMLCWMGWRYTDLDIQTFIDAAAFYDGSINYKTIFGYTSTHERYKLGLGVKSRITGSDLIRQVRTASRSMLAPNSGNGGKLQLKPEKTLAEEQPTSAGVIPGSNFNTSIKSKLSDGTTVANGYVAWRFGYGSILPSSNGDSSLVIDQLQVQSAPNTLSVGFSDEENGYAVDSLTLVDAEDVGRSGNQVNGSVPVTGLVNFDQSRRTLAYYMAKNNRGNTRNDSGGTYILNIETNFVSVHLRMGHIVLVDYPQLSLNDGLLTGAGAALDGFLARVISIKPSSNFERASIQLQFHKDSWCYDTFGQDDAPKYSARLRDRLTRPAYPWLPNQEAPMTGNPLYDGTELGFAIRQLYEDGKDNIPIPRISITGKQPINGFASNGLRPPSIRSQGTTAPTGGTIKAGQTYYAQICVFDADGKYTPPSDSDAPCVIDVPAGANTATITIPVNDWDSRLGTYALFVGTNRNKLCFQQSGAITSTSLPASITLTSLNTASWGIPDVEYDTMIVRAKRCRHAGVVGIGVLNSTPTTIQVALYSDNQFGVNQFAPASGHPYYCTILGMVDSDGPVPIIDFEIASNTGDTLTFASGQPDPTAIVRGDGSTGLLPNDVLVIYMRPTVGVDGTGNYIEDSNFINASGDLAEPVDITAATNATPIVVTTPSGHGLATGDRVYIQNVTGNTGANGVRYASVISSTSFSLYSNKALTTPVAGTGAYVDGGTSSRQTEGMNADEEIGRELYVIRGTGAGTSAKIKSNTDDRIYIEGDWVIEPDASSIIVVLDSELVAETGTDAQNNSDPDTPVTINLEVSNYNGAVLFVQSFTVDGGGNESFRALSPFRLIYIFGQDIAPLQNSVRGNISYV